MAQPAASDRGSRLFVVAAVFVVIAALYFAQEVLIPFALSILLAFILSPLVTRLEHLRIPRVPSVLIVVTLAMCLCVFVTWVLVTQFVEVAERLPAYQVEIRTKLNQIRAPSKLTQTFTDLQHTVMPASQPATAPATQPATAAATVAPSDGPRSAERGWPGSSWPVSVQLTNVTADNPLPVRIYSPTTPIRTALDALTTMLHPLATASIVLIFVIFMLLGREDLRERMLRLVGQNQLSTATEALSEAGGRTSQYLLSLALVNLCFGCCVSGGLWLISKLLGGGQPFPNVLLWGLICGFSRFIPYVGTWVGAALPIALSFGLFRGYAVFGATVAMFLAYEGIVSQFIEPRFYGARTGMSMLAVLASAVFWAWLWGPVGLLLSMPLTVVLLVIGKYVPQLQFLDVLLGDEPVLEPHVRLYQRMLAGDSEEAAELARSFLKDRTLCDVYEQVLLPALTLTQQDHARDEIDGDRHMFILETVRDLVDELWELERAKRNGALKRETQRAGANGNAIEESRPTWALPKDCVVNLLCLAAHNESDAIAGLMLARLLTDLGYCVNSLSHESLASEMVNAVETTGTHLVIVSSLPPAAVTHARYICKRLSAKHPEVNVVVGLWTSNADLKKAKKRIAEGQPTKLVTNFMQAIEQIQQMIQPVLVTTPSSPQPRP